MENVYHVEPVKNDKLPLPPISSLLSVKCKKPESLPQYKNTPPMFIPPQVKRKKTSPLLIQTKVECNSSSSAPKCDKMLNSPTAGKSSTFPPMSSPPPPPHLLCGLSNVQTFQHSPSQGQSVDKRGAPIPGAMASYLSGGFLDPSSIGTTNMMCGPNFQYQQTSFGEVSTLACQTIIYQNTSIISPRTGFRSSICNHPSAWKSNVTNFSSPETKSSLRSKKMTSHNPSAWIQDAFKPKDCRPRLIQSKVVDQNKFSCDEDLDQLKEAGLHATIFGSIPHSSQQLLFGSQNSHTADGTGKVISIPIDEQGTVSVSSKRPPGDQVTEISSQKSKDICKLYVTCDIKDEKDGSEESNPKTKPISPVCPPLLADANKFSNSSGTTQQLDPNKSGFNVPESSDFNLFPYPKIDEIESVGSNDLGVDDAEYHPIALPLGCYQFNDSDTESDTTNYEGSLGRRMAKMGQDKFDLHLDKTLTLMEWSLIPIQMEPTNKSLSDAARCSRLEDPRLQQSMDKNQVSKETCKDVTLQQSMDKNQVSRETCKDLTLQQSIDKNQVSRETCKDLTIQQSMDKNQVTRETCKDVTLQQSIDKNQVSRETCKDLTLQQSMDEIQKNKETCNDFKSIGSIVPRELEFEQQEEHSVVGNKNAICLDKRITEMLDVSFLVSSPRDDLHKGSENNDISQSTENENGTPDREKKKTFIEIENDAKKSSEIEVFGVSGALVVKSPVGVVSEELLAVSRINEGSDGVLTTTSDVLSTSGEVSADHQSRSSFCDTSDAAIGAQPDNPLTRIATVLSQNLSKTSKDKVGKNVKRLSQNISSAMQKVKGTSENTTVATVGNDLQKRESCISDSISDTFTKAQIKEDTLIMTITTQRNKSNVSTRENGCTTPVPEKKELPPLWHDYKSCSECHVMSSQEKQLLQESADFLGEDFNAFSRRSQRKRGVPKKLENYFSECREVAKGYKTAVNKRKRQKTRKNTGDTYSTCDRTDHDSDWDMVELYQDDVVVEERNNSATVSGVETRNRGTRTFEKLANEKYPDFDIDEEFLLKSTPKCTRNMLKRLTTSLITSSNHQRRTVTKSQKTLPISTTTEVNTAPSAQTKNITQGNSVSDDATSPLLINPVNLETTSDPPTKGNIGDPTTPRTTDLGTALVNAGPVTQNCTVYITQEDTVKDVQTQTNGQTTCTSNSERQNISTTDEMATVHVSTGEMKSKSASNKRSGSKLQEKKSQKSVSRSQVPAKKKKGRPFKTLTSSKEAAITCVTDGDISGNTGEKYLAEGNDAAATTKLKSTSKSEEITSSSDKKKKSKEVRKNVTSSSTGKPKKSKMEGKKKGDLLSHDNTEDNVQAVVVENVTQSTDVKKKSKNMIVSNEDDGDAEKLIGTKKKVQGKKQKTKEKADDSSLLKDHSSPQTSKKVDVLKQKGDGKETLQKKKKIFKNSSDGQKKKTSWKRKKGSDNSLHSQSKNLTKNISNLVMKNKKRILQGYAKFRVVTDPDQAAELKSNRPTDCRFCKKTITFSALKDHEREHKFKCIRCRIVFNNQKEKEKHYFKKHNTSKKHGKVSQVSKVNELYHCMLCEKSFIRIKTFQRHLHSNIHGYNRHIQNRCLSMMGSHTEQSTRALQRQGSTLHAIGNGDQEVSPDDQLIQQRITWNGAEDKSPKTWTLPENQTNTEELKKQLIKTVEHAEGRDTINYYYHEPEILEWMKKQESFLQKMSALPNSDMHQRAEPYAVVTNFSMMNYLTSGPQCSGIKYVSEEEGESIQCMHNNSADGSTPYRQTDPADGSTHYTHTDLADGSTHYTHNGPADGSTNFIPNNTAGCSTNCLCDGPAMASASFVPPFIQEDGSQFLPHGGSMVSYPTFEPSNTDTKKTNSSKNTTEVGVSCTMGQFAVHDESMVSSQNNILNNRYQLLADPSPPDQPMLDTSRILNTSSSDHDHSDVDQGPMGWLSRAIQDIEADPYYQVPDFLDSQSDLDNDSGFNEHSVSKDSSVFRITGTPSTSESAVTMYTRNYTDLDNGQQIQVCDKKDLETGQGADTGTVILPVRCPNSSQSRENSGTRCLEPLVSDTLSPAQVSTSKQCCKSQINDEVDKEDQESQELLKLKYAQILCDIRNDVLGTRSYQE
ncbi:uncharacterized protein LOC110466806 [Mizuhopecten yessoensis]|uniref:C2H2-type domain-containing protein n=1 Tax=Mizuhopecten yessoensis TaxID=6573 RepID=A0A210PNG6_MIZYE|nr:uncharacterized protein LOC110466806 [Mizuhopecten yessoensis]OWF38003.1 hypothetical protein KP79_PYT14323 [Mizuhopecten yessoensis]